MTNSKALRFVPLLLLTIILTPIIISGTNPLSLVTGLVNVAPFIRKTSSRVEYCPRTYTRYFNSPDATIVDNLLAIRSTDTPTDDSLLSLSDNSGVRETQILTIQTKQPETSQISSKSDGIAIATQSQKVAKPSQRTGVWMPPSKNIDQRRGTIFSIQQPQDLLDFVIEDERLSVGEYSHRPLLFNIAMYFFRLHY